jgi:hypothetical protein
MIPELKERPMPEVGGTSTFLAITPLLFTSDVPPPEGGSVRKVFG